MRALTKVDEQSNVCLAGARRGIGLETAAAAEIRSVADDLAELRRDITDLDRKPAGEAERQVEPSEQPRVSIRPGRRSRLPWVAAGLAVGCAAMAAGGMPPLPPASAPVVVASLQMSAPLASDGAAPANTVPQPANASEQVAEPDPGAIYATRFANVSAAERICLARAIYYEARGESFEGQVAVAQVVLNRARARKWPNTLCRVVYQGVERGQKCQFSFACMPHAEPAGELWEQALQIADQAVTGHAWLREAFDATYYHSVNVAPVWRLNLASLGTIGSHVFYRDRDGLKEAPLAKAGLAASLVHRPARAVKALNAGAPPAQVSASHGGVPNAPAQVKVEQTRIREIKAVGSVSAPKAAPRKRQPAEAADSNWSASLLQPRF